MACSRIIGSKRWPMTDAATKTAIVPRTRKVAIPASQYFLRLVTPEVTPVCGWLLGKDCFLKNVPARNGCSAAPDWLPYRASFVNDVFGWVLVNVQPVQSYGSNGLPKLIKID